MNKKCVCFLSGILCVVCSCSFAMQTKSLDEATLHESFAMSTVATDGYQWGWKEVGPGIFEGCVKQKISLPFKLKPKSSGAQPPPFSKTEFVRKLALIAAQQALSLKDQPKKDDVSTEDKSTDTVSEDSAL